MDKLNDDLEPYIDERINNNISNIRKSEKWKNTYTKFNSLYDNILNNLQDINQESLDELRSAFIDFNSQEKYQVYKLGFVDGIKLREQMRGNKNS